MVFQSKLSLNFQCIAINQIKMENCKIEKFMQIEVVSDW